MDGCDLIEKGEPCPTHRDSRGDNPLLPAYRASSGDFPLHRRLRRRPNPPSPQHPRPPLLCAVLAAALLLRMKLVPMTDAPESPQEVTSYWQRTPLRTISAHLTHERRQSLPDRGVLTSFSCASPSLPALFMPKFVTAQSSGIASNEFSPSSGAVHSGCVKENGVPSIQKMSCQTLSVTWTGLRGTSPTSSDGDPTSARSDIAPAVEGPATASDGR